MSQDKPTLVHPTAGKRGMTELHYAAYCNDADAVRDQLQSGVPVDVRDDNGCTPLHWSIDMAQAGGDAETVVDLLLKAGASPNAIARSGFSVLMMACGRNNEAILKMLVDAGADVELRTAESTPLHEAAGSNFSECIRKLLLLGADPTQLDSQRRTAEQLAVECGFEESVTVLQAAQTAK